MKGKSAGGFNFNPGYYVPTHEDIYLITKPNFKLADKANAYGTVWEFKQDSKNPHPAPFPESLVERMIQSTDAKVILDPFGGSGTVAFVARNNGRNFISIDLSQQYCELAQQRFLGGNWQKVRKPKTESKLKTDNKSTINDVDQYISYQ